MCLKQQKEIPPSPHPQPKMKSTARSEGKQQSWVSCVLALTGGMSLSWSFSEKCSSPVSQASSSRKGTEGVLVDRAGLAAGWWQGHRGWSTRRGLRGSMKAIARKGFREMAV